MITKSELILKLTAALSREVTWTSLRQSININDSNDLLSNKLSIYFFSETLNSLLGECIIAYYEAFNGDYLNDVIRDIDNKIPKEKREQQREELTIKKAKIQKVRRYTNIKKDQLQTSGFQSLFTDCTILFLESKLVESGEYNHIWNLFKNIANKSIVIKEEKEAILYSEYVYDTIVAEMFNTFIKPVYRKKIQTYFDDRNKNRLLRELSLYYNTEFSVGFSLFEINSLEAKVLSVFFKEEDLHSYKQFIDFTTKELFKIKSDSTGTYIDFTKTQYLNFLNLLYNGDEPNFLNKFVAYRLLFRKKYLSIKHFENYYESNDLEGDFYLIASIVVLNKLFNQNNDDFNANFNLIFSEFNFPENENRDWIKYVLQQSKQSIVKLKDIVEQICLYRIACIMRVFGRLLDPIQSHIITSLRKRDRENGTLDTMRLDIDEEYGKIYQLNYYVKSKIDIRIKDYPPCTLYYLDENYIYFEYEDFKGFIFRTTREDLISNQDTRDQRIDDTIKTTKAKFNENLIKAGFRIIDGATLGYASGASSFAGKAFGVKEVAKEIVKDKIMDATVGKAVNQTLPENSPEPLRMFIQFLVGALAGKIGNSAKNTLRSWNNGGAITDIPINRGIDAPLTNGSVNNQHQSNRTIDLTSKLQSSSLIATNNQLIRLSLYNRTQQFIKNLVKSKITDKVMLEFENQGGHTLTNHGSFHTKETLKIRTKNNNQSDIMEDPSIGVPLNSPKKTDFRIRRGKIDGEKVPNSTKWKSNQIMNETIENYLITSESLIVAKVQEALLRNNLDPIKFEGNSLQQIGDGWITETDSMGKNLVWRTDLQNFVLFIKPNLDGSFLIHTAYPTD